MAAEKDYDATLRQIAEQERQIARQRQIVEGLQAEGIASQQAQQLLKLLETTLSTLKASLGNYQGRSD